MFPPRGGVREHLIQLYTQLEKANVQLVRDPLQADILHVESSYPIPMFRATDPPPASFKKKKIVYVCHGGFVPRALPEVIENLHRADKIISVAQWVADKFFAPHWLKKTVVIPNGINPDDFKNLLQNSFQPGFVLYAKEWSYQFEDFQTLVKQRPDLNFVTVIWPENEPIPTNVIKVGLLSREQMKSLLAKAGCLVLTGSEVCPTMLLEAWYLGVPVVAKNIDGSKELMGAKFSRNLYTDDLSSKIDFALANRLIVGARGHSEVLEKYLWPNLIDKYLEVYEQVLSE